MNAIEATEREGLQTPFSACKSTRRLRYERFGESRLWEQQLAYYKNAGPDAWRRDEVPHFITNTAGMADVYAECIVDYWQTAIATGDIDLDKPFYILELGAGCGRLTYLLLKSLREKLPQAPQIRWCYLASDIAEANLDFIATHPYLKPDVDAGYLDTVVWNAERGGDLRLRARRLLIRHTDNPVVVVANYVFDGLRQDLFGFHYGQMFEGRIAIVETETRDRDGTGDTKHEVAYEWQPIERAHWLCAAWQRQLDRYRERLDSTGVLFPSGPLRCIDNISKLARRKYLLLSADKGVCTEQDLRLYRTTDFAFHGSFSLPVNYHALAECLSRQGARVDNIRHRDEGSIYHIAMCCGAAERRAAFDTCFEQIVRRLHLLNPDDYFTLKKTMETVSDKLAAEQLLALLRLGRYDYRMLDLMIEPMLAKSADLTESSRRPWHAALERSWKNYFPIGEADPFYFNLSLLAIALEFWSLAKETLRFGISVYGSARDSLHSLAHCEASTGRLDEAIALLEQARTSNEATERDDFHRALSDRLEARQSLSWYCAGVARDRELALEPLDVEHASAFFRQYRDPHIGIMTCLPEFATTDDVAEWIETTRQEPDRAAYAVVHQDVGFVGVVSLQRHRDTAYFCFWIGTDYQGRGYGERAGILLVRQAAACGVSELFTSAYADNFRSLRALSRLQFCKLDVQAPDTDENVAFLHRSLANAADVNAETTRERFLTLWAATADSARISTKQQTTTPSNRIMRSN